MLHVLTALGPGRTPAAFAPSIRYPAPILKYSTCMPGFALVDELKCSDKMTEEAAKSWIEQKTGRAFDTEAMYELRWPPHEDSPTWSGYINMHVHIMNDAELMQMEREYRKHNKLPPRRPGEPSMFKAAMGRAEGPRQEHRKDDQAK